MNEVRDQRRAETAAVPAVSRPACVVLVRTVLESDAGGGLADAFRRHGGDDPAVEAWLTAVERTAPDAAAARAAVVEGLAAGFSVAGVPASTSVPEAAALAAAVAAARADREARERFSAAVASARLEALREFAYGAGHEINNPLANIATRAQSLLLDEQEPERRRRLAVIVDQAFRGRDMIGGLMIYARPPKPAPRAVAVDGILSAVIEAVRPMASARDARLACSRPPAPVEVFVDEAHVIEAIRLLTLNALEAEAAGGRVTLEARRREALGSAPRCEVVVADAGPGMDSDTLRRAFDPFFSGREAGRGIGLGLPKAWRLVEINDGTLAVDTAPGRGTRVTISLPLAVKASPGCPV